MPSPIPRVPPVTSTTRPDRSRASAMVIPYQANAWFVDEEVRWPSPVELRPDGIRVVTMDAPPVNALTVQGWFDVAGALDEASADLGHQGGRAARRGPRLQRRRRHQGDAADHRLRRADRCEPRLLRGVQGRLRVRGPGDRRGQRLLPRRRRRPGRQRRLHRGQRRRLLRRAGGRPWRARRRHPPGPAGAAAPDAHPLLHRPHDHGRRTCSPTARSSRWSRATSSTTPRSRWPARSPPRTAG